MKEIGIIGYGNFSRLMCSYLKEYFKIYVYNRSPKDAPDYIKFTDPAEALSKDIIIISIPVQHIENFFIEYGSLINKNATVIDVCSVKIKPINLMLKYLPETVSILGTHPLFGPQSSGNGIRGNKIVITPVRVADPSVYSLFCEKELGLKVIITDPETHDREMGYVQALNHFIMRGLKIMDIPDSPLKTRSYEKLYGLYETLRYDSDDLFLTIQRENPYAGEVRDKFLTILKDINDSI